jgi:lipopolysaccharide/colanic/teichoic acid biosynthesis glycosyltransferase
VKVGKLSQLERPSWRGAPDTAAAFGSLYDSARPGSDSSRLGLRLYALIFLADAASMFAAFVTADLIRFGTLKDYGLQSFLVLFPIYVAVGFNGASWSVEALQDPRFSAAAAIRALLFSVAVATGLFFSLKIGAQFSRPVFGMGSLFALAFIPGSRLGVGQVLGNRCGWTFKREMLLVDGVKVAPANGQIVIDARAEGLQPTWDDPALLDRIARRLQGSDRVTVACPQDRRQLWARMLRGGNLDIEILTPELEEMGAIGLRRTQIGPAVLIASGPLRLRQRVLKRAFDVLVAVTASVFLAPVMLFVAIAIKLDSHGPILFRQLRMGRGNRLFVMLKFRSMCSQHTDPDGLRSVARGDRRLSSLGRFLRRTSLDELPQLFNVLRGDMSIVGPRPHALGTRAGGEFLWVADGRYWSRHAIKPGITGLAQVRGFRGATPDRCDLISRVDADLQYMIGWHVGRDFAILLRTVAVLVHRNAF